MRLLPKSVALLIFAAGVSSCLDSREEIWIAPDSSGAARINVSLPAASAALCGGETGVARIIGDFVAAIPAITTHLLSTETAEGRIFVDLTFTFSNALDLINGSTGESLGILPPAGAGLIGKPKIGFQGLSADFTRTVDLSNAIPGALFIPQRQLEGHSLTTIIHLPKAATSHNATSTMDGDRTLIWETTLAEAFERPVVTSFSMPLPIPWSVISLVLLLLAILVSALVLYLRRGKAGTAC